MSKAKACYKYSFRNSQERSDKDVPVGIQKPFSRCFMQQIVGCLCFLARFGIKNVNEKCNYVFVMEYIRYNYVAMQILLDHIISIHCIITFSVAAIPFLLPALKEKLRIDPRVVDFCVPVMATINRGGSSIFVVITALFVAQSYEITIGVSGVVVIM